MAKPIKTIVKLQIPAGKATPAPPVGTALGPHGINIGEFVKKYNEATGKMEGEIVPVEVTIFQDRTFEFALKTPPASDMLRKAASVEKDRANPTKRKWAGSRARTCAKSRSARWRTSTPIPWKPRSKSSWAPRAVWELR